MKKAFSMMLLLATIFTFTSCGGSDDEPAVPPSLSQTHYSLYAGETIPLKGISLKNLNWYGHDKFVAEIDNNGTVHANKVGHTRIYCNDINMDGLIGRIEVDVMPKIKKYSEPLLHTHYLGEQVKYENGYIQNLPSTVRADIWGYMQPSIPFFINECGLPWSVYKKDATMTIFQTDKEASPYMAYVFDENAELMAIGTYINTLKSESLAEFLDERYLIYDVDINNYKADFAHAVGYDDSPDVDYIGRMQYSSATGFIIILYMPLDNGARSYAIHDFGKTFEALENAMKQ